MCLGLFIAYVVEWKKTDQEMIMKCHENTSVVLTEVNHLFTSSLSVTEDTNHIGDFYRDIEVHQLDSKCDSLPTREEINTITNGTDLSSINGTTFYALAGSSVTFGVCGTTSYAISELERLELILCKESLPLAIGFFHVGTNGEWQCKEKTFILDEPGYYTIIVLPPTYQASFTFNATYSVHEIDTEQLLERAIVNYSLHMDQDSCEFHLKFGAAHSCFVATIMDNPNTLKQNVHIQLHFTKQKTGFITGGVLTSVLIIVTLVMICVCVWCACSLKETHKNSNRDIPLQDRS